MNGVLGLFVAGVANAWWDGGHVLSAEVAARHLTALGRSDVLNTVNRAFYSGADLWPCHAELQSSATWLDYAKNRARASDSSNAAQPELGYEFVDHLRMWDRFHYYDALYVDPESAEDLGWPDNWAETTLETLDHHYLQNQTLNTILFALTNAETALWGRPLAAEDKTAFSFALNLHHVTHLVGDLHMPCHTAAMWDYIDHLERGHGMHDEGANYIPITYEAENTCPSCVAAGIKNLHAFWDAMGGYETRNRFDIWGKTDEKATDIMTTHSNTSLVAAGFNLESPTILDIMKESFSLASIPQSRYGGYHVYKDVAFKQHFCAPEWRTGSSCTNGDDFVNCPQADCHNQFCRRGCDNPFVVTAAYRDFAIEASKERIALVGYRLAHRLIKAVDNMSEELKDRLNTKFNFARSRQRTRNSVSGCVTLRQPSSGAEMNVLLSVPILLGAVFALFN